MTTKTLPALAALALAGALLTGCASSAPATPAAVTATTTAAPATAAASSTSAPTATTTPAAPVADKFSQVVNGHLYQGTQAAPVKIGTDTPGAPPAAQASLPATLPAATALAKSSGKYLVLVTLRYAPDDMMAQRPPVGYYWAIYGVNEYGTWRALVKGDVATKAEGLAAPKVLDGRELDRSEYILMTHG